MASFAIFNTNVSTTRIQQYAVECICVIWLEISDSLYVPYCRLLFSNAASGWADSTPKVFTGCFDRDQHAYIRAEDFVLSQHSTFVKTHIVMLANVYYLNAVVADRYDAVWLLVYGCLYLYLEYKMAETSQV
jgi:hypothetical protein